MLNPFQSDIDFFLDRLYRSIQAIESKYIVIPRYENDPVPRERAYCYELYHQLRLFLGDEFPYTLHGEIDKRGSPFFERVFDGHTPNPDFIVHRPGTMDNLVAIEVKPSRCSKQQADDDIEKLWKLITEVNYQLGIFLIFGSDWKIELSIPDPRILVLLHTNVGEPPSQLFRN
jgi:hypothetical protein